ncbi:MAG TPA: hypothetical protein VGI92_08015 [Gemmatimonadales bacterium]|jgi:tetratricopeptide (TPR) repeat protein
MRRLTILLAALLAAAAPTVRAQQPAERASLDSMRTGFGAISDSMWLLNYERQRIAVARVDRDNPVIHMELGFVSYRLGEITGAKKRYQDAASEFQWASDLRPAWPYAWYFLGLAELSTGEADLIIVENIRQLLGLDALSLAARHFARAIEADPSFSMALVDLANTAMKQRISPRLVIAQAALRQAASTAAGRVPAVQLVRGRIERRLLENDSALAAFHAFLSLGGDSGVGGIELARTFAQKGLEDSSVAAYFSAVGRRLSDTARIEVRRDLHWFATPGELAEWDAVRPDSMVSWLRRFWFGRDLSDGRRPGERLPEQLRRYQYAVQNFGLASRHRGFDVAFAFSDSTQQEFDDRGLVYLRHGAPDQRTQFSATGVEPNESWLYRGGEPDGTDMILHFAAINDVQDFRLVQSLLDVCARRGPGFDAIPQTTSTLNGSQRDCVQSRAQLSDLYQRLAQASDDLSPNLWAGERRQSMEGVHHAISTDSYALQFQSELHPVVSIFAVADATMHPELHLVFAVPGARLHPRDAGGSVTYPLALRMLVYDSSGRLVGALDTIRVFRASGHIAAGSYLTEQLSMKVPAGNYLYSFVIEEPGESAGDVVHRKELEIPRLDTLFAASDVILGREGSGLIWRRPEGEVALNPLMRYPKDGAATIYYELYGLPQAAHVATRVRITRAGGRSVFHRVFGGGGGADLAYETVTDSPIRTRVSQHLDLKGLAPGHYVLRVELTDPESQKTLVRESPFDIDAAHSS